MVPELDQIQVGPFGVPLAVPDPCSEREQPPPIQPPPRARQKLIHLLQRQLQHLLCAPQLADLRERRNEVEADPGTEHDGPADDGGQRPIRVLDRGRRIPTQRSDDRGGELGDVRPKTRLLPLVLRELGLGFGEAAGLSVEQRAPRMCRIREQRRGSPPHDLSDLNPEPQRLLGLAAVGDDHRGGAQQVRTPVEGVGALQLAVGSVDGGQ